MKFIVTLLISFFVIIGHSAEIEHSFAVSENDSTNAVTEIRHSDQLSTTVFADLDGYLRHMAVGPDGTVYVAVTVRMGRG